MSEQIAADENGWYYNITTGQVEHGMVSAWTDRMGPYDTEQAARQALDIAKQRNEQWDADDEEWRG